MHSCYASVVNDTVRIIGIDPGLRRTGWGIIASAGTRLSHVASGVLLSDDKAELALRLVQLRRALESVIAEWQPDEAAVEETFVNADPRATLKLGQARAIALLVPAEAGVSVAEYAPNQVKKSVVGAGHAEKDQIRHMVKRLLPRAEPKSPDEADALAIAICHAHHRMAPGLKRALVRS
jgi:crossover junction endodeoxyribonuclease RuvC